MSIITERLDCYITSITEHKDVLTANQLDTIKELVSSEETVQDISPILFEKFNPTEIDVLYTLVKTLQRKVVTSNSDILSSASTRDLSSLIGGITSLLRAFSAQQATINEAKEMGDLKAAVLAAIEHLDTSAQERFFSTLKTFE